MEISIHATEKEMIDFLKKRGYEVKRQKRTLYISCYHNDVDEVEVNDLGVYKDGKPYWEADHDWMERVFKMEVNEKLKEIILA